MKLLVIDNISSFYILLFQNFGSLYEKYPDFSYHNINYVNQTIYFFISFYKIQSFKVISNNFFLYNYELNIQSGMVKLGDFKDGVFQNV